MLENRIRKLREIDTASGRCWHWDAALNIKSMVAARGSSFESAKSSKD